MSMIRRLGIFWVWVGALLLAIGIGMVGAFQVFTRGLAVTGLTDGAPWGLWITLDLSCVGLSAGAFSLSAITYLLGREQYKPLARVAVFIGILGYLVQGVSTLVGLFVGAFIAGGMASFSLKVARGQPASFGDVFSGGRYFGRMLVATLGLYVAVLIGLVLCIVPGYIVMIGLSSLAMRIDRRYIRGA